MPHDPTDNPDQALAVVRGSHAPPDAPAQRIWVLIPCAGLGTRAASALPKQYRVVAGRAVVEHTLAAFAGVPGLAPALVLLAPGDTQFAALESEHAAGCRAVACGGPTRAATVANGLAELRACGALATDWVMVHDAARCLVTSELILRLIDACRHDAVGGLLAVPVADTVKRAADGRALVTVDRALHWLAQTPQMFRLGELWRALQVAGESVTNESSAIEALGLAPRLVVGDQSNFKLTVAQDFAMAQAILLARGKGRPKERNYDYP